MERTSAAIEESRVEFVNVSYQAFPAVHNDLVDDWLELFFFFSSLFFVLHFFIFTNQVERERERKDVFRRDRRERVEARIYTFVLSSFFLYSIPPPSSFLFSSRFSVALVTVVHCPQMNLEVDWNRNCFEKEKEEKKKKTTTTTREEKWPFHRV